MSALPSLRDEVCAAIEGREPVAARALASELGASFAHVRVAIEELDKAKRAVLIRRGRGGGYYVAPLSFATPVCVVCHHEFERATKSKRATCDRSCRIAFAWASLTPAQRAQRVAVIAESRRTPEARARTQEFNKRRWADPMQREKLADQSRKRWRDPETKALISSKIRANHQTPEFRQMLSERKKRDWADPEKRRKMLDASAAGQRSETNRQRMSRNLKERWQDPVGRERLIAGIKKRYTKAYRKKLGEAARARWADPAYRAKTVKALNAPDTISQREASRRTGKGWKTRRKNIAAKRRQPREVVLEASP